VALLQSSIGETFDYSAYNKDLMEAVTCWDPFNIYIFFNTKYVKPVFVLRYTAYSL